MPRTTQHQTESPRIEYLIGKNFVGNNFRQHKLFVGKCFLHLAKNSSLFTDKVFTNKVRSIAWRSLQVKHNLFERNNPTGNYLLQVNNRYTKIWCEICSKLTIPERRQWRHSVTHTHTHTHKNFLRHPPLWSSLQFLIF